MSAIVKVIVQRTGSQYLCRAPPPPVVVPNGKIKGGMQQHLGQIERHGWVHTVIHMALVLSCAELKSFHSHFHFKCEVERGAILRKFDLI